jgi:Chitobiase/beta-hexosaminidase C-terminal domain
MVAIIFLNACGSLKSSVTLEIGARKNETRITDITPANPKAGDTVTLSGKGFPIRTKNLIGRIVLADGSTKDSTLTVASDTSASFTVPTGTTSEVKSIVMMTTEKTFATYDIKAVAVGTLDALTFSPASGTYADSQSVTISSTQPGVTIYYTTDGSTPDNTKTLYSGAITISATTTLKAIGIKADNSNSTVASETYTMVAATPTASPVAGTYTSAQTVTLSSATTDAVIHRTTDGLPNFHHHVPPDFQHDVPGNFLEHVPPDFRGSVPVNLQAL